jgi:adenylosuccinate synthase
MPPYCIDEVILVCRTYPIRVAGASGPLNNETDWETMSIRLGRDVCEQTTVTKKTRRIAQWDEDLFLRACMVNGPTQIAVTFTDYLDPKQEGREELTDKTRAFIHYLESISGGVPVTFVGVGGPRWLVVCR